MTVMGQTAYSQFLDAAFPGMAGDNGIDYVESGIAIGAIGFGLGLVNGQGRAGAVRLPTKNTGLVTFSGALVTSNVTNLNVNGVAISPVTFATDDATTLTAIAAAIVTTLAAQGITGTPSTGTHTVTVVGKDGPVVITGVVVTAGAGQATAVVTQSEGQVFRGISRHMHLPSTLPVAATPGAGYQDQDMVNVFRRGRIWVVANVDLALDDVPYLNVADAANYGKITNVSTGNILIPSSRVCVASATMAGLKVGQLEMNLP